MSRAKTSPNDLGVARLLPPRLTQERRLVPTSDAELNAILAFAHGWTLEHRRRLQPWSSVGSTTAATQAPAAVSGEPGTILSRVDVTPSLMVLRIARPAGLRFEAGQHAKFGHGGVTRPYSIASAPAAPDLEICLERVAGGALTSKLFALQPGAKLDVRGRASGDLLLDASAAAHVMVATVTGVAPFVSMLRDVLPRAPSTRVVLIHGARFAEELVFRKELEALSAQYPAFEFWPAVTQPTTAWKGRVGRVTEHVAPGLAAFGQASNAKVTAYACGNPDMVRDVSAIMRQRSIEIRTEAYWD